ncbi:MAG: hypothetical protein C3F19_12310 [Rhodocyclales bacterium]|nr:MAG: hypothetical protein C3F19_12310 [Rhodocyclales bacterium]
MARYAHWDGTRLDDCIGAFGTVNEARQFAMAAMAANLIDPRLCCYEAMWLTGRGGRVLATFQSFCPR